MGDDVRVVKPLKDDETSDVELQDVKHDGKEVGEVVMRGNIVMKEVSHECFVFRVFRINLRFLRSTSVIQKRHARPSAVVTSTRVTSLSCILKERSPSRIAAKISSSPAERCGLPTLKTI